MLSAILKTILSVALLTRLHTTYANTQAIHFGFANPLSAAIITEDVWRIQHGSITTDSDGNVFVVATMATSNTNLRFVNNLSFRQIFWTSLGAFDAVLIKISADGQFLWKISVGSPSHDFGTNVFCNPVTRQVLVIFQQQFTSNTFTLFSHDSNSLIFPSDDAYNGYLGAYDNDGILKWALSLEGPGADWFLRVEPDSLGNNYIAAEFSSLNASLKKPSNITVFNVRRRNPSEEYDGLLAKVSPTGDPNWSVVISSDVAFRRIWLSSLTACENELISVLVKSQVASVVVLDTVGETNVAIQETSASFFFFLSFSTSSGVLNKSESFHGTGDWNIKDVKYDLGSGDQRVVFVLGQAYGANIYLKCSNGTQLALTTNSSLSDGAFLAKMNLDSCQLSWLLTFKSENRVSPLELKLTSKSILVSGSFQTSMYLSDTANNTQSLVRYQNTTGSAPFFGRFTTDGVFLWWAHMVSNDTALRLVSTAVHESRQTIGILGRYSTGELRFLNSQQKEWINTSALRNGPTETSVFMAFYQAFEGVRYEDTNLKNNETTVSEKLSSSSESTSLYPTLTQAELGDDMTTTLDTRGTLSTESIGVDGSPTPRFFSIFGLNGLVLYLLFAGFGMVLLLFVLTFAVCLRRSWQARSYRQKQGVYTTYGVTSSIGKSEMKDQANATLINTYQYQHPQFT